MIFHPAQEFERKIFSFVIHVLDFCLIYGFHDLKGVRRAQSSFTRVYDWDFEVSTLRYGSRLGNMNLPSALPPICIHLQKVILDSELLMVSFDASTISNSVFPEARRASSSNGYETTADSVWTIRRLNIPRIVSPIADIYLGSGQCRTCLKSDESRQQQHVRIGAKNIDQMHLHDLSQKQRFQLGNPPPETSDFRKLNTW